MNKTTTPLNILFILAILGVVVWGGLYVFMVYSFFNLKQQGVDTAVGAITVDRAVKKEAASGDVLKSYFVETGKEAPFISSIEDLCKKVSVSCVIRSIDEGDTLSDVPVKPLHFSVGSSGSFDNTIQLLHLFELSPYPITISAVNLSKTTSWNGSFDLSLPVLIN